MGEELGSAFRRSLRAAWTALLCAAALAGSADDAPPGTEGEVPLQPVHADTRGLEDAVLEATAAYLHEDGAAARKALDGIAANCRVLRLEDEEALGREVVVYDGAFHTTLNRARELASRGDLEESFNQFVWVQRSCVACHRLARRAGLSPERDD
jgi:hypothetical protein